MLVVVRKFRVWHQEINAGVITYELNTGEIISGYKALREKIGPQTRNSKKKMREAANRERLLC